MILNSSSLEKHRRYFFALILVLCAAGAAAAQEFKRPPAPVAPAAAQLPPPAAPVQEAPVPLPPPHARRPDAPQEHGIEKIAAGRYRLGEISIDKKLKRISFPARVNMDKGLLEYLLVRNGGKTHESLLRTAVEPTDLQVALLLLGLEGADRPLATQGDPSRPEGEPVDIRISFPDAAGKSSTVGPEAWIARKNEEKVVAAEAFSWVFTGSVIQERRFLAQIEGSIIAIYHDPVALVDNASPGGENDRIWQVNEKQVPPVGTPVMVTISRMR